jgi:hypothetical protein
MSTDVKYFHSEMPGAPAELAYVAAGTAIAMFDACLVNGFGLVTASSVVVENNICTMTFPSGHSFSQYVVAEIAGATPSALNGQHRIISTTTNTASFEITLADQTASGTITAKVAAAGWEKAFSDTNIGVYRSPKLSSTRLFFRVGDANANSYTYRVDGYENMTDASTGTGMFRPTNFHFQKNTATSGTRKWFVIANSSMVYVGHLSQGDSAGGYAVGCFGDIRSRKSNDVYRGFIRGNFSSNTSVGHSVAASVFDASPTGTIGAYARDWTGIGGNKAGQFAETASADSTTPGRSGASYPNGPDYGLLLRPLIACESDRTVRGWAPGLYVAEQNLEARICATNRVGTFLADIPDLPGAVLAAIPVSFSGGAGQWYACFVDVGRDWGN